VRKGEKKKAVLIKKKAEADLDRNSRAGGKK